MQRLKAKRRRPVFTPFTSHPPAAAFLQNIITQSNLQKANLHFWDHPCPNSSWFIQEKLRKKSHQKNWWTFTKKKHKTFSEERERERYFFPQDFLWRRRAEWFLMRIWYFIIWAAWWDFSPRSIEILLWDHSDPLWGLSTPSRRYKRPFHPFHFHFSFFTFHFSLFTFTFPHRRADTNAHSIPFTFHFSPFIVHFSLSLLHTIAQIQMPLPSLSLSLFTFHFHFSTPSRRYKRPFHPRSIQKITFAQLCWRKRRWNGERDRKGKTFPSIQYQFKSTS